jgi:hypothetical protein
MRCYYSFLQVNKGLSFYGGSNDKTSNAAPAILPVFKASAWSGSLIKSPLEV